MIHESRLFLKEKNHQSTSFIFYISSESRKRKHFYIKIPLKALALMFMIIQSTARYQNFFFEHHFIFINYSVHRVNNAALIRIGFIDYAAYNITPWRISLTTKQVPPVTEENRVAFFSSDHRPSDVVGELLFFLQKGEILLWCNVYIATLLRCVTRAHFWSYFTSVVKLVCVFVLYQKPKFDKATLQVTSRVRRIFILRGRAKCLKIKKSGKRKT